MARASSREKLLDAALVVFSQGGYADATTVEIAKVAGVNERTLFRHFGDKESLLAEVVNVFGSRARQTDFAAVDACLTHEDVAADLTVLMREYYRTCFANIDLLRVFISSAPFVDILRDDHYHVLPCVERHAHAYFLELANRQILAEQHALMTADLLVGHVHRTAYDEYMHNHRRELTPKLEELLAADSERQSRLFAQTLLRQSSALGGRTVNPAEGESSQGRPRTND